MMTLIEGMSNTLFVPYLVWTMMMMIIIVIIFVCYWLHVNAFYLSDFVY